MSEPRRCIHGRTEKQRCAACNAPDRLATERTSTPATEAAFVDVVDAAYAGKPIARLLTEYGDIVHAEAVAALAADIEGLRPLAADAAAQAHLQGWGILSHHTGTFRECPDTRCVRNRALLHTVASEPRPTGGTE